MRSILGLTYICVIDTETVKTEGWEYFLKMDIFDSFGLFDNNDVYDMSSEKEVNIK